MEKSCTVLAGDQRGETLLLRGSAFVKTVIHCLHPFVVSSSLGSTLLSILALLRKQRWGGLVEQFLCQLSCKDYNFVLV